MLCVQSLVGNSTAIVAKHAKDELSSDSQYRLAKSSVDPFLQCQLLNQIRGIQHPGDATQALNLAPRLELAYQNQFRIRVVLM